MRALLILLSFIGLTSAAVQPFDLRIEQRDAANTINLSRWTGPNADGTTNGVLVMVNDPTNPLPKIVNLASYFNYDATGNNLTLQNVPQTAVSGLGAALANIPGVPAPQYNVRTIGNTGWLISSSKNAWVSYSVAIDCALSLSGGQAGYVDLEIDSSSSFTAPQFVARARNGNTGTLTIGLNTTQNGGGCVSGYVPAGYSVRLKSTNTAGTCTFTYIGGQEVLQ